MSNDPRYAVSPEGAKNVYDFIKKAMDDAQDAEISRRIHIGSSQLSNWGNAKTGMNISLLRKVAANLPSTSFAMDSPAERMETMLRVALVIPLEEGENAPVPMTPQSLNDWLILNQPELTDDQRQEVIRFTRYKMAEATSSLD
jgi:hypothetical protein